MKTPFFFICLFLLFVSCNNDITETIYVSGKTVKCTGAMEQECLQIKFNKDEDYALYYDAIEGFQHDQGTDYTLKVKRIIVKNPPADGSDFQFSLIEIIDKQPTPLALDDGSWLVAGIVGFKGKIVREPILTLSPNLNEVSGSTGCNRFFGKIIVEQSKIKFQNIGSTKMSCEDSGLQVAFLENLKNTFSYDIIDNVLMLKDEQGTVLLKAIKTDRKE